jgi:alpha-beta hydrolase superfamily lysophospholipase
MTSRHVYHVVLAGLLLLLAACAPHMDAYRPDLAPGNTVPALSESAIIAADGRRLALRHWPAATPRALLLALHGFNDYSFAFDDAATYFAEHGITVYAYDQRGFGESPRRGLWAGEAALVDDAVLSAKLLHARHENLPLVLMGESMGGAIALLAAQKLAGEAKDNSVLNRVILVAPALRGWSSLNFAYKTTLWLMAHTLPGKTFHGRGLNITPTDNIELLRRIARDPLVIRGTRVDAIYGLVGLMESAAHAARDMNLPTLLLYGTRDDLVAGKTLADRFSRQDEELRIALYNGGYHMLLRDLAAERVWKDIAAYVADHNAPLPSDAEIANPEALRGLPRK